MDRDRKYCAHAQRCYDDVYDRSWKRIGFYNYTLGRYEIVGYLISKVDEVIVCFRGSDDPSDYLAALDSRRVDFFGDGLVHHGYFDKFKLLIGDVNDSLLRENGASRALTFIGHSYGGALAQLSTSYYLNRRTELRFTQINCVTFGSTKVGDGRFVESCEGAAYQKHYVNRGDPVPSYPGFLFYSAPKFQVKLGGGCCSLLSPNLISNHVIATYVEELH
jgi:hypothetical protein